MRTFFGRIVPTVAFVLLLASAAAQYENTTGDQDLIFVMQTQSAMALEFSEVEIVITDDGAVLGGLLGDVDLGLVGDVTHGGQGNSGFVFTMSCLVCTRTVRAHIEQAMPPGMTLQLRMGGLESILPISAAPWIDVNATSQTAMTVTSTLLDSLLSLDGRIDYRVLMDAATVDLTGETLAGDDSELRFTRTITFTVN